MTNTEKDLKEAFAGESQANRKYLAFAKQAEKEGHKRVARLFKAVAEAETIHAHAHLRALGAIGSTAENLREALGGEQYEFSTMYPPMIEHAKADGNHQAERSFNFANEVEKVHAELYQKALDNLQADDDTVYLICPVCGHVAENHAPERCPVCNSLGRAYFSV